MLQPFLTVKHKKQKGVAVAACCHWKVCSLNLSSPHTCPVSVQSAAQAIQKIVWRSLDHGNGLGPSVVQKRPRMTKSRRQTNCAKNKSVASLHLASASLRHRENRNSHCLKCKPKAGKSLNTSGHQDFLHPVSIMPLLESGCDCLLEELQYASHMHLQARTAARLQQSGTPTHMAPAFKQCGNSQLTKRYPKVPKRAQTLNRSMLQVVLPTSTSCNSKVICGGALLSIALMAKQPSTHLMRLSTKGYLGLPHYNKAL